ncbi:uncharacterized protein LOC141621164 isoform X1 [Silene latifolia]|uniref:uncharacterized protein LOC141621164 isoform X1 n=1 Tax=Silene latifolia TaxID=37657 RepID=UPI003D77DB1D
MAATEEPILSRIDRLDHLLRNLEEIRVGSKSPKSCSSPSTPSSGTRTTDSRAWSQEFSPRSRDKYHHYRSIEEAMIEMEHKGSLLERVSFMEDRLIKVCTQVEGELEAEIKHEKEDKQGDHKGIKELIKSCVTPKRKGKGKSKKLVDT